MRYSPFIITSAQLRVRYKLYRALYLSKAGKLQERKSSTGPVVLRPIIRKAGEYDAPARVHHRLLPWQHVPVHGVALQSAPSNGSPPDV
jgi:hypothetical protein